VTHVFGVPGAKIDPVYNALVDSSIQTVVCRHEQNAAFIAQGMGRLTGKASVCLVTSGPGSTNLATGFATATAEGTPVVGFGGSVPLASRLERTHQNLDSVRFFDPITKYSVEVDSAAAIAEVVANVLPGGRGWATGCELRRTPDGPDAWNRTGPGADAGRTRVARSRTVRRTRPRGSARQLGVITCGAAGNDGERTAPCGCHRSDADAHAAPAPIRPPVSTHESIKGCSRARSGCSTISRPIGFSTKPTW
jgi:hypothetical protein